MLAESVQLSGELLVLVLFILFLILATLVALAVLGFVWAARAARGSQLAMAGWIVVLVIEGILAMQAALAALQQYRISPITFVMPTLIVGQVIVYTQARRGRF